MWSIVRRVLIVVLALAAVGAGGWWFYGGRAKQRFEARVAALRAAGQPTRIEDLATPPIPDEENGAKLLEQAHRMLEERQKASDHVEMLLWKDEHTEEERLKIVAYLRSLGPYFALLEQIPERPGFRLDIDWSKGPMLVNSQIPQFHTAVRMLTARAEFDPDISGRTERAAASAVLLVELGERGAGPFVVGHFVSWTVTSSAVTVLRKAIREPGFDAAVFRRIVDPRLAEAIPERGPHVAMLVEERVYFLDLLRVIDAGDVSEQTAGLAEDRFLPFLYRPGLFKDAITCLDLVEEVIRRADTTPEDALRVSADLSSRYSRTARWDDFAGRHGALYSMLFASYAQDVARLGLARVVMALLEHRQTRGAWPDSLSDLGEMPMDPFSGEPFVYDRTERGCKVRSAKEGTEERLEGSNLLWTLEDDQIPAMPR